MKTVITDEKIQLEKIDHYQITRKSLANSRKHYTQFKGALINLNLGQ